MSGAALSLSRQGTRQGRPLLGATALALGGSSPENSSSLCTSETAAVPQSVLCLGTTLGTVSFRDRGSRPLPPARSQTALRWESPSPTPPRRHHRLLLNHFTREFSFRKEERRCWLGCPVIRHDRSRCCDSLRGVPCLDCPSQGAEQGACPPRPRDKCQRGAHSPIKPSSPNRGY